MPYLLHLQLRLPVYGVLYGHTTCTSSRLTVLTYMSHNIILFLVTHYVLLEPKAYYGSIHLSQANDR